MKINVVLTLLILSSGILGAAESKPWHLSEVRAGSGYMWVDRPEDKHYYKAVPYSVMVGFDLHPYFNWSKHPGTLKFTTDFFCNKVASRYNSGVETGIGLGVLYAYPFSKKFAAYLEGSVAPMYLGVRTEPQGSPSFNFLDQAGTGLQYYFRADYSFNVGYRWRHISHGNVRSGPNGGINTNGVFISISKYL
ncbi:MAG: acyloxyacyl hydrolase [Chlamydiota bacterium]